MFTGFGAKSKTKSKPENTNANKCPYNYSNQIKPNQPNLTAEENDGTGEPNLCQLLF